MKLEPRKVINKIEVVKQFWNAKSNTLNLEKLDIEFYTFLSGQWKKKTSTNLGYMVVKPTHGDWSTLRTNILRYIFRNMIRFQHCVNKLFGDESNALVTTDKLLIM